MLNVIFSFIHYTLPNPQIRGVAANSNSLQAHIATLPKHLAHVGFQCHWQSQRMHSMSSPSTARIDAAQTIAASEFTPMRIRIAKANRQLDCSRARRELGYIPRVSVDEGLQRTVKHFSSLSANANGGK
jgi:nucleoside-diphosphate-sugar epimerase